MDKKEFGNRPDGKPKGLGWRGPITLPDDSVATEMSIGVEIGGKEMLIPLIVPDTTDEEVFKAYENMKAGKKLPEDLVHKAVKHAMQQFQSGRSVFKD